MNDIRLYNFIAPSVSAISLAGGIAITGTSAPLIATAATVGFMMGLVDEILTANNITEHHYLTGASVGMGIGLVAGIAGQTLVNSYIANLSLNAQNTLMELAEPNLSVITDDSVVAPVLRSTEYVAAEQFFIHVCNAEYFIKGYELVKAGSVVLGSIMGSYISQVGIAGDIVAPQEEQELEELIS